MDDSEVVRKLAEAWSCSPGDVMDLSLQELFWLAGGMKRVIDLPAGDPAIFGKVMAAKAAWDRPDAVLARAERKLREAGGG